MKDVWLYDKTVNITFDDEAHAYFKEPEHIPIDGVTGIIKRTLGWSPALAWWQMTCAVDHIKDGYLSHLEEHGGYIEQSAFLALCKDSLTASRKVSKTATDVGSKVHYFAEHYKQGQALPAGDDQVVNGCQAVVNFFDEYEIDSIYKERIVFSKRHWYVGTCDRLAYVRRNLAVVDFKTSKPFKNKWKGPYIDQAYQLCAYAVALEEEFPDLGKIEEGWIVRLDKETGACDPHRVRLTDELKRGWIMLRSLERNIGHFEQKWTEQLQEQGMIG